MDEERGQTGTGQKKIDIVVLLHGYLRGLKKLLWLVLTLTVVVSVLYGVRAARSYTPRYKSSASFAVSVDSGSSSAYYYNESMASQMAETFPYLLESELLLDLIKSELGTESINGTISASCLDDTNIFILTVTSTSAEDAYNILQAVINNYPTVSRYVVGETELVIFEEPVIADEPYNSPGIKSSMLKGAEYGLIIGLVIVLIYAAARRTIRREEDVRTFLGLSCLGVIPMVKNRGKKKQKDLSILTRRSDEAFQESVRGIALRESKQLEKDKAGVVMVVGAAAGEGTTTTAKNLAYAMAELGKTVFLIDADLRRANESFGAKGLEEIIEGKARLVEAAYYDKKSGVISFACRRAMTASEIQKNAERIKSFFRVVKGQADYIVIDSPPANRMSDAAFAAEAADGVIFAAKQDHFSANRISDCIDEVCSYGVRFDGLVITMMETGLAGYGYGKYSRYYSRYAYRKYGYGSYGGYGGYGARGGYYGYGREERQKIREIKEEEGEA